MGRLRRTLTGLAGLALATLVAPQAAAAFDRFGAASHDSTYGDSIRFEIEFQGGAPDRLELMISTPGSVGSFVIPVDPGRAGATYRWDTSADYLTPNTPVAYRWRAYLDEEVILSDEASIRYEDDRPGLDWQRAQLGEATVHWYGSGEEQARRFGELTARGVARAEELLGTRLAGPVDVFVYATREDFFGALGPGAREWTGAAAYSELRTIFMWLGDQSAAYLERAMVHEVTHIVFHDATDNPYHEPARWLNEGIATWSEESAAGAERAIVELEAGGAGLFAFEAITEQFPIGERGGRLSYAQGATMIDLIVSRYGEEAIARIAAAYREGASDAEALEAGTGIPADELYAAYFADFGIEPPGPVAPAPIQPSNVERPPAGAADPGGVEGSPRASPHERPAVDPTPVEPRGAPLDGVAVVALLGAAGVAALAGARVMARRAARRTA